jgi:hypothetical protein
MDVASGDVKNAGWIDPDLQGVGSAFLETREPRTLQTEPFLSTWRYRELSLVTLDSPTSETGSTEVWLVVNDDGTVTRHIENAGWAAYKSGVMPREETLPAAEAKEQWDMPTKSTGP